MPSGQAVVVGATGALGGTVVRRLVATGVPVVAVARSKEQLDELAGTHELITPCVADIADDASIQSISAALDGPVRLALFAAGLPVRGSADTIEPDALSRGANIKLGGLVRLLHSVRDRLEAGSRFVTFAGSLGLEPKPHEAGPGAINAGVFNLMRQISQLYGPHGITTHTIAPGPIDSPRLRRIVTSVADERGVPFDEVWQTYEKDPSLGRLPSLDEVAWTVTMLLEPEAGMLHGSVLNIDGGVRRGIQ